MATAPAEATTPFSIRDAHPRDLEWVVRTHGALYRQEYRWDARFEALVAAVANGFAAQHDPQRERCWIAEVQGARVGSVMIVQHPERVHVAKLRLLLVLPEARGLGIGKRLVRLCTDFCTQAGYTTISLWTNSVLHTARALYEAEGYRLVHREPHQLFGEGLLGETWERAL
ncbi:GNAT family N-acetyltransferase [Gemmatimonas sp.]|jgi:GNAT superfamily N-acetyltransferase|uniref:GNAT family N-acetyltransferase n=1 Tax=Gemmatimonas sp. TaxID=1962908 RepID=UPI0037C1618B